MQIEISEKEKTALSILLGLRQKFARDKKTGETYSAHELHKLFSELISKISKEELRFVETLIVAKAPEKQKDEIWGVVDEAIERSKIKRYDWNKSLIKADARDSYFKKQGYDVEETYKILCKDERVQKFLDENKEKKQRF